MTDSTESTFHVGKSIMVGLLIWAVMGVIVVAQNGDTLSQGLRIALIWPAFVFIAPPGWFILMLISRIGKPSTPPSPSPASAWGPPSETSSTNAIDRDCSQLPRALSSDSIHRSEIEEAPNVNQQALETQGAPPPLLGHHVDPPNTPAMSLSPSAFQILSWNTRDIDELAKAHGWICQLCLKPLIEDGIRYQQFHPRGITVDFVIPLAYGGSKELSNVQPVHVECRFAKGDRKISNSNFRAERQLASRLSSTPLAPWPGNSSRLRSSSYGSHRRVSPERNRTTTSRRGNWQNANAVIQKLISELQHAKLSDEQRERALSFIYSVHENDLLSTCQRGHSLTLQNTYFSQTDSGRVERQCRICRRMSR